MLRKSPDRQELLFAGESPSRLKWHQCMVSVGPLGRRIGFRRSSRPGLAQPLTTPLPSPPTAVPVAELPPAVLLPAEPDVGAMSNSITSALLAQEKEALPRATTGAVEVDHHRTLAAAAQKGDRKAFAALVEIYQQTVYGFLRARLLEPSDAEDLCQEVFLRCYVGHEKLARATSVGPWLIGIARNLLREHVRRACRRKERRDLPGLIHASALQPAADYFLAVHRRNGALIGNCSFRQVSA